MTDDEIDKLCERLRTKAEEHYQQSRQTGDGEVDRQEYGQYMGIKTAIAAIRRAQAKARAKAPQLTRKPAVPKD